MLIWMIKLIIFDYDDTLVRSSDQLYQTDTKAAIDLGFAPVSREIYFSAWGLPHEEMIKRFYPQVSFADYLKSYERFYKSGMLAVIEGARETLDKLAGRGFKLAILSAAQRAYLEEEIKTNKLLKYLSYVHSAESSPYKKPDPRVFDNILAHFKIGPEETVYVGDVVTDYLAASSARIRFIGVTSGIDTKEKFNRNGCNDLIGSISELADDL